MGFAPYVRAAQRAAQRNYFFDRLPAAAQDAVPSFVPITATGGNTETTVPIDGRDYRVHTFLTSGTFEVTDLGTEGTVEYLVVAGGGAGGSGLGGGGGAGGLLTNVGSEKMSVTLGSHPTTVGEGGVTQTLRALGTNGGDSAFLSITASGGGAAGAHRDFNGTGEPFPRTGGSGGGAGQDFAASNGVVEGASGIAGQGTSGGDGVKFGVGDESDTQVWRGGGGGGAGGAGLDAYSSPGDGGDGLLVDIDGNNLFWGGGGGGCSFKGNTGSGSGGMGGGGGGSATQQTGSSPPGSGGGGGLNTGENGFVGSDRRGGDGGANTGGGGGGSSWDTARGGNGGSGIVIVRYPLTAAA